MARARVFIAQSEKAAARQSLVQALRNHWLGDYRLRRLTLYDLAERRPLAAVE